MKGLPSKQSNNLLSFFKIKRNFFQCLYLKDTNKDHLNDIQTERVSLEKGRVQSAQLLKKRINREKNGNFEIQRSFAYGEL